MVGREEGGCLFKATWPQRINTTSEMGSLDLKQLGLKSHGC